MTSTASDAGAHPILLTVATARAIATLDGGDHRLSGRDGELHPLRADAVSRFVQEPDRP